jgi:RimJ/RimL family protein N-acetyltransferase
MTAIRKAGFSDLDFIIDLEWREEFGEFLVRWKRSRHHVGLLDEDMRYLVLEDDEGEACGFAVLAGLKGENDAVEVRRIAVSRPGEGLGRLFLERIKELAFGELGANRLWLDLFEGNDRARAAYRAAGFVEEGVLRDALRDGERYRSLIVMSMLARENARKSASGF